MSLAPDDTLFSPPTQSLNFVTDTWMSEIVPRLPMDLEVQAHIHGAWHRKRRIACASDLLRALLAYVLCASSFRLLGAWAVLLGLADLSEAAWRKRLRRANAWLLWLLGELWSVPAPRQPCLRFPAAPCSRRIVLVDATTVGTPGGTGDDWRMHTAYDFTAGRLSEVVLSDRQTGEHLDHYGFQEGDIVIADSGYGYRRNLATARHAQVDVVLRITYQGVPVVTPSGDALNIAVWLQRGRGQIRPRHVGCRINGHTWPVRLLALRLPPAQAQEARLRALRNAQKHGRQARILTLALAEWVLLVTTLDVATWPVRAVQRLYRVRWQVELVFKRMKQLLQVAVLRVRCPIAGTAVLRLKLIAWLLHADEVAEVRALLTHAYTPPAWGAAPGVISTWRLTALGLDTLRQQVRGQWTQARVRTCLAQLGRFLVDTPRQREQQETAARVWLTHLQPHASCSRQFQQQLMVA